MPTEDTRLPREAWERLGRYEILLPIASGGMASVYLALGHGISGFQRQVAVKLIHPHLRSNTELIDSLREEGLLTTRIRHRNVVPVLDVGLNEQGMFLVMEYIEGDSLSGLARAARNVGQSIPTPIAMRILTDALAGLHAAHELRDENGRLLDVVHRDFSPQNILVSMEGVALLTDFGIAKAATRIAHTATGIVKGKLSYLSPEQVQLQPIDRRADVWAAGMVAWEMLTGKARHAEGNAFGTLLDIVQNAPPRVRTIRKDLNEAIDDAVSSALTLDLTKRCATAKQFRDALLAACPRRSDLADVDEVASFMRDLLGEKMLERRVRVSELLAKRRASHVDTNEVRRSVPGSEPEVIFGEEFLNTFGAVPQKMLSAGSDPPTTHFKTSTTAETGESISWAPQAAHSQPRALNSKPVRIIAALALLSGFAAVIATAFAVATFHTAAHPAAAMSSTPRHIPRLTLAPSAETPPPVSEDAELTLQADAPIASIQVGQRTVRIAKPSMTVSFVAAKSESSLGSGSAVDTLGRRTSFRWGPDEKSVRIRFGTPEMGAARGRTPLAADPY